MDHQIPSRPDSTPDIFEFGLMAAASPAFADALVRALLGADRQPESQPCDDPVYNAHRG